MQPWRGHPSLTLYWLRGYFSRKYSSQPHTFRIYLPWYSKTQSFSCSEESSILRVFFLMASAMTCSGTQSWLIFRVYFCLSLFGETITQITTMICPVTRKQCWMQCWCQFISLKTSLKKFSLSVLVTTAR